MTSGHRRLQPGDRLVIATHNAGKLREIADLIAPYGIDAVSVGELGLAEPEETGDDFIANAVLKAQAATVRGMPALADDSGLVVPALGGAPGIHSARWAGPERDFRVAMERVEAGLADTDDRRAWFTCVLTLAWPDGHVQSYEGQVHGRLVWPPRGSRGFGYDPMFVAEGQDDTFGEMNPTDKHAMSHRAVAFRKLTADCLTRDGNAD